MKLFKNKKTEKTEKADNSRPTCRIVASGHFPESEPKYVSIENALKRLMEIGLSGLRILTDGEDSSHMWTAGFKKTYDNFEDFVNNSQNDYYSEIKNNSTGPQIVWEKTYFLLTDPDSIEVRIQIEEDDGKLIPYKAFWMIYLYTEPDKEIPATRLNQVIDTLKQCSISD